MALDKPTPQKPRCLADDPEHRRGRGEEMRVLGEDMKDRQTRADMLKITEDYAKHIVTDVIGQLEKE